MADTRPIPRDAARRAPSGLLGRAADNIWLIIAGVATVAFAWWVIAGRSQEHHLTASLQSAALVVPGLDVKVDGVTIGKVGKTRFADGHAVVGLGIDDDDYWPLHQGSRVIVRFGTTIGNGTRYLEVIPGPRSAPALAEDAVVPERDTIAAVEFDQVFNTVNGETRVRLRSMLSRTATSLTGHEDKLNAGLRQLPTATGAAGDLLGDLAQDTTALESMVANTSRVSRTLASRSPAVTDLVDVASATFGRFATNAADLQSTIDKMPAAFSEAKTTLARVNTSVHTRLTPLVGTLRPGLAQLPALAAQAVTALRAVRTVAPSARSAISALHAASPDLTKLLTDGTPLVQHAGQALGDLAPMMACIRPYAPETGGFFVGWGGWVKNYTLNSKRMDPNPQGRFSSHYARVEALEGPESVHNYPTNTPVSQLLSAIPGVRYAFGMPPGYLAGKPQFNADCGYGRDTVDPAKDPENGTKRSDGGGR